jgi:hypothetical protein
MKSSQNTPFCFIKIDCDRETNLLLLRTKYEIKTNKSVKNKNKFLFLHDKEAFFMCMIYCALDKSE